MQNNLFLVDTPDPQFTVTCPKIQQPTLRSFKTQNIPNNVTEGEINRTFCFVMPEDINPNDEFPVEVCFDYFFSIIV